MGPPAISHSWISFSAVSGVLIYGRRYAHATHRLRRHKKRGLLFARLQRPHAKAPTGIAPDSLHDLAKAFEYDTMN